MRGADDFGMQLRAGPMDDCIDVTHLPTESSMSTGVALIVVDASGQNRIVVVPGANGTVAPNHIDAAGHYSIELAGVRLSDECCI